MCRVFAVVVAVCAIVVCMQQVDAQCFFGSAKEEQVPINGRVVTVYHCVNDGVRYNPGQSWTDTNNCLACSCSQSGLSCCSTISTVMVSDPNPKCINVVRNCKNVWVKKNDATVNCPDDWIPSYGAVGKK